MSAEASHTTFDKAWGALRQFPQGATAKTIAPLVGWKVARASGVLGRLAAYDLIDRVPNPLGRRNEYRYAVKRYAHV